MGCGPIWLYIYEKKKKKSSSILKQRIHCIMVKSVQTSADLIKRQFAAAPQFLIQEVKVKPENFHF